MADDSFVWTQESAERFFHLRLQNEWLFKKKKQAWKDFYRILLKDGFPKSMTLDQVRKKWQYTYDAYRIAKKASNKSWLYYNIFDKYLGSSQKLDKYESWDDNWRVKLIKACEHWNQKNENRSDLNSFWRYVENDLRSQDLPLDCCIQDVKGLWHHLKITFHRKYRIVTKRGISANFDDFPLYQDMQHYYETCEPEMFVKIIEGGDFYSRHRKATTITNSENCDGEDNYKDWSKDMTESFIQMRLQNEWLFKQHKWAWKGMYSIMVENGFPPSMSARIMQKKWGAIYREYQKAKATNNTKWVYWDLFETYTQEKSYNIEPLRNWQEVWVLKLIQAKTRHDALFYEFEHTEKAWREVEKDLRGADIPLDHSLLELTDIWEDLVKTYTWKRKFADKGMLNEQWPYFEAMEQYVDSKDNISEASDYEPDTVLDTIDMEDDLEDDIKLIDLKHRLDDGSLFKKEDKLAVMKHDKDSVKGRCCRVCNAYDGISCIFDAAIGEDANCAEKLRIIGGIEVEETDHLPSYICASCLIELNNAFRFREKCQETDKKYKENINHDNNIKIEYSENHFDDPMDHDNDIDDIKLEVEPDIKLHESKNLIKLRRALKIGKKRKKPKIDKVPKEVIKREPKVKQPRKKYEYTKICEVCGSEVKNMKEHIRKHKDERLFRCEICDKSFKYKSALFLHNQASHSKEPCKICPICGKEFYQITRFKRHFVYHANERKFVCETCGKGFNTKDILTVHCRSHTDERPYSCSDCGKTFRTAGCVWRHKNVVHKKKLRQQ